MRKGLIFLSAFTVSFLIIYTVYYHGKAQWQGSSYLANADTLKTSVMTPHPYQPSLQKNIIYSAGMISALQQSKIDFRFGADELFKNITPANLSSVYCGPYSIAAQEKIGKDVTSKDNRLENVAFHDIKDGDKMLFSYVYRNAELPDAFMENRDGMEFNGKNVRSIRYTGQGKTEGTQFYLSKDGKSFAFRIPINNEEEVYWLSEDKLQEVATSWREVHSLCSPENIHLLSQGEEAIFPEIDLFLIRTYTANDMESFFSMKPSDFKHIEDWLKLKLSTSGHTMDGRADIKAQKPFRFGPSSFFCVKRKAAVFPYIGVVLHNSDILMRFK